MIFYCTNCWSVISESAKICPLCGDDILARQASPDFVDKLIAALHNPEVSTPARVAWVLGEWHERGAVERLIVLVPKSSKHYVIEAAVEALGKIGDWRAWDVLQAASNHTNPRVCHQALQAIQRLQHGPDIRRRCS